MQKIVLMFMIKENFINTLSILIFSQKIFLYLKYRILLLLPDIIKYYMIFNQEKLQDNQNHF